MRRLLDRRTLGGALLFAIVATLLGVSTACNSSAAPSGSESKAANNVNPGGGTGGGGGGGGGTPGTALRLVAFESGAVFNSANGPVLGAAGEIWCFVTSNSGSATTGAAFAAPTFTINGTAEPTTFEDVLSLANPPPTTANGWFCVLTPAALSGTLIASSSLGNSNAVTLASTAFPAGNTAAGGFTVSSPVDAFVAGYTQQPAATPFNFALTAPSAVSSYLSLTLVLDRTNGGTLAAHVVERATPGALTAGSATNVSRAYLNTTLPPLNVPANANSTTSPQVYTYQVIPLNASGWGVGSSIDDQLAQWVWFGVQ